ncbi:signal peptidase II [Rhodococcus sp. X156]|uniref:signal peptidase II n=1 Tax=Rhodococcus sp. X156 TaxID=2499145 RepID=UPI000FD87B80|nr:signal peptidase II [Rhodococcus sp. X156]
MMGAVSAKESPPAVDEKSAEPPVAAGRKRIGLLVTVAALIVLGDLASKIAVVANVEPGRPVRLLGGSVYLVLVRNPGAAFSLATGMTWLLTIVAAIVVVVIIRMARRLRSTGWAWGLGLILGGALGNLIDRLFRAPGVLQGHVVDFVSVFSDRGEYWPVFNLADSCIVVGGALLVLMAVLGREPDGTRLSDSKADDTKASDTKASDTKPSDTSSGDTTTDIDPDTDENGSTRG